MNLHYKIEFFTDWHCGSGLAAGADVDALVIKDSNRLPFVPGKTIKGLVREAVEELKGFTYRGELPMEADNSFKEAFGIFQEGKAGEEMESFRGSLFFTNATLSVKEKEALVSNQVQRFLFRSLASTAIEENGITSEHSLRKTEVVVPCTLYGEIKEVPLAMKDTLIQALHYIKRLGQNRNRGLGRCRIVVTPTNEGGIE